MAEFDKLLLGALECGDLPELGIRDLPMRVDTGAATSALHVRHIEEFSKNGRRWVSFDLDPAVHKVPQAVRVSCRVKGSRTVRSSTAAIQQRVVIATPLILGGEQWPIRLTLTDRSEMNYPMLLGREALQGRAVVDPEFEFLFSPPRTPTKQKQ